MTFVKICGLTRPEHLTAAIEAGVDLVGLTFVEKSRRRVTVEQARTVLSVLPPRAEPALVALPLPPGHTSTLWFDRCAAALEQLIAARRPLVVGLFADQPASLINSIAEMLDLDLVQLSGHETWEDCLRIRRPVIKAERVEDGDSPGEIITRAEAGTGSMLMLDASVPGQLGGTGVSFDWSIGQRVAHSLPLMLAGGLTPANVGEAVLMVRPWGVDVSSGVETEGVKDVAKIAAFAGAVRAADAMIATERTRRERI